MPERLWTHGIYPFLELLGFGLPDSRDHMFTFIYIAGGIVEEISKIVPDFKDTWNKHLRELETFRKDALKDIRDSET